MWAQVNGAMNKVDEWAENAEGAILGPAAHSFESNDIAKGTPTRSQGSFNEG